MPDKPQSRIKLLSNLEYDAMVNDIRRLKASLGSTLQTIAVLVKKSGGKVVITTKDFESTRNHVLKRNDAENGDIVLTVEHSGIEEKKANVQNNKRKRH